MKKLILPLIAILCCSTHIAAANSPAASAKAPITQERVKQIYNEHCFVCHYAGGAGSPKVGDEKAWNFRIKDGKDILLKNTLNGLNFMPAKGLCNTCTMEELSAVIDYMLAECPKCDKLPEKNAKKLADKPSKK